MSLGTGGDAGESAIFCSPDRVAAGLRSRGPFAFLAGSGVTTMPLELFDNIRTARVSVLNAASTLVLVVSAVVAFVASVLEPPTRAK